MMLDPQNPFAPNGNAHLLDPPNGNWRGVRNPGDDISDLPIEVQLAIGEVWTPEVVASWQAEQAARDAADAERIENAGKATNATLARLDDIEVRLAALEGKLQ